MTASPASLRAPHRAALILFVLVWFSGAWFGSKPFNPNNSTRLFAAMSLAEQGDATIDEYAPLTIDKAAFDGHIYLDKAPGMTLLATPLVWLTDRVTGDTAHAHAATFEDDGFDHYLRLRLRVVTALVTALLTAIAAALLFDLACGISGNVAAGLIAAISYALGTPVWGWSTTMFGHAPVAALLLIATWAGWRGTAGTTTAHRLRYPLIAGAALGLAVLIEFPAVLPGTAVALWAMWRTRGLGVTAQLRIAGLAIAAGATMLLPLLGYNLLAFGTPFRVGYQGVVGFDGMSRGFFGLGWPDLGVLTQIIAGPDRGFVFVAPVLVLGLLGLVRMIRIGHPGDARDVAWLALAIVAIMLLYNSAYFYWSGGDSTGPRHCVPAFGCRAIGLDGWWQSGTPGRDRATLAIVALAVAINLAIAAVEITAELGLRFPLYDPVLTGLLAGKARTIASEFWGWPPMAGLALYLALALPLGMALIRAVRREGVAAL